MGFNAVILIRNSDLPLIEQDPKFGANVASVILGADVALHLAGDAHRHRTVTLSEVKALHKEQPVAYDIQSATPAHAGVDQVFLVEGGGLLTQRRFGEPMGFAEMERFALKAKEIGIESKIGPFDSRKAPAVPFRTEAEVMRGWDDDEFHAGVTALSVIIDALGEIERDEVFGRTTAHRIRSSWMYERALTQVADSPDAPAGVMINKDVPARNHGNAAAVITTTLAGESDIVLVGRNWGRALRADTPINHKIQGRDDFFAELRAQDIKIVADALLSAGFSVMMPGGDKMLTPRPWQKSGFITDFEKPEEDSGLTL